MASSSKNISMPLVFAISVGSVFAMVACTLFGMAWYEYEDRKVINSRVEAAPMHNETFEARYGEGADSVQSRNLNRTGTETVQPDGGMPEVLTYTPIDRAMEQVVADHGGHVEHDHAHDYDDTHEGHDH